MLQTTKLGKLLRKCLCASFSPSFLDDAQDIVNNWIIFLSVLPTFICAESRTVMIRVKMYKNLKIKRTSVFI